MKVVLLIGGGRYSQTLLNECARRGVAFHAVVLRGGLSVGWRSRGPVLRWLLLPLVPFLVARAFLRHGRKQRHFRNLAAGSPFHATGRLNSPRMKRDLTRLAPDILVVADCGIVDAEMLAIARAGTLGVHQGLLPWVRGNGAVANAILGSVPVGSSAYWMDEGIDTGRVIMRRMLPLTGAERTLDELERKNDQLAAEMCAELVATVTNGGPLPVGQSQEGRFPLGRWVPKEERVRLDEMVTSGVPLRTVEEWRQRNSNEAGLRSEG